jgi:ketosteroid isomerase-like protein
MDTKEVAQRFVELSRSEHPDQAGETFWAEDVVSIEAMDGPMSRAQGREAVRAKGEWWVENHTVHSFETHGPYVNGDQFAVRFNIDVTVKATGQRMAMEEVGLYTVKDGKIVEERFFY